MNLNLAKKPFVALGALVLAVAAAGCSDTEDGTPTSRPSTTLEAPSSDGGGVQQSPTNASGTCQPPQSEGDALPTSAPATDGWQNVRGVGVPVSSTYGPLVQEGELWTCYQHSPTGALFAAAYATPAFGAVPGFAETWIEPGETRNEVKAGEGKLEWQFRIIGFRFTSYSPESAEIEIALQQDTDQGTAYSASKMKLVWTDNGWMIPSDGYGGSTTLGPELAGFIRWSTND